VRIVSDGKEMMLSAHECGDEPYLLASTIPGLMVVIGADRYAAGILAMEHLRPDVFLLDDGFQHLRLHRDLNILLMDYARPFGNGWCLPSGLLREPKSAALRADLVIYTRCPVGARVTQVVPGRPSTCARHQLVDLVPMAGGEYFDYCTLHGRNVLAFAGIAEPNTFFDGLRAHGVNLVATICFPDHTVYDHETLDEIAEVFRSCGADMAITTEKDGVKLAAIPHALLEKILLSRLTLEFENPMLLSQSLSNLLQN
jgi:tetraacyldisaccharide 4'-kinase